MLALAGCGGHSTTLAGCLNATGFLVEQQGNVVRGSSAHGVNFTLTLYAQARAARRAFLAHPASEALIGDALVDFAGNPPAAPGGAPGKLSRSALATIRGCLAHP